jgi:hypothetical protein
LIWFFSTIAGGIVLSLMFYDIINVDIDLAVLTAGVVATLIAVYVIRVTLWVFKKNM